ncbi:hypothetical protein ACK389_28730 [Streptomyces antibioticus]|uniref:hypothetical protein n=1 Tax=Streptomyces antibioticus TaxID=1890 RepID=UPI00340F7006
MTATLPAAERTAAATSRTMSAAGWGTVRTVLRVHRAALVLWGLLVVALTGGAVWITELTERAVRAEQASCERAGHDLCDIAVGWVGYDGPITWIGMSTGGVSVAVAAFAGGALIGRELDSGTARLAWTQGVTPTRWLTAKLAVPALAVTVGVTVLVLVFRWAWAVDRPPIYADWWSLEAYAARGPVAVAHALCALAVGTLAGLLLRRSLPALGVSVAAMLGLTTLLTSYRDSLWPTVTATAATEIPAIPENSWEVESGTLAGGRPATGLDASVCDRPDVSLERCWDDLGVTGHYVRFHPESHYWPLQLVESGIVLAVAALATTAAFLLLRRRTATSGG